MKDALVKVELFYGEPNIGKVELVDNFIELEILVPGSCENKINLIACTDSITITAARSKYVAPFSFALKSPKLDFKGFQYKKDGGILFIEIPLFEYTEEDVINIKI